MRNLQVEVQRIDKLENKLKLLKQQNAQLQGRLISNESYSRLENIVVTGLEEASSENCVEVAHKILAKVGVPKSNIQRCHRLGKSSAVYPICIYAENVLACNHCVI